MKNWACLKRCLVYEQCDQVFRPKSHHHFGKSCQICRHSAYINFPNPKMSTSKLLWTGNYWQNNCRQTPLKIAKMGTNRHIWSRCLWGLEASKPRSRTAEINFGYVYDRLLQRPLAEIIFLMKWEILNNYNNGVLSNAIIIAHNYISYKFELKFIQFFSFYKKKIWARGLRRRRL